MIALTGAAGFIGSCLLGRLNAEGIKDAVIVDDFSRTEKSPNYSSKKFSEKIGRDAFPQWLEQNASKITAVLHIGARTDTTEFDRKVFDLLNVSYSQQLWSVCARHGIPFIYASSAATYGLGEHGYSDDASLLPLLKPLNPYGDSKHQFDLWAMAQELKPAKWHGLKFFNVYGPNEYHKGRMASVIFHAHRQINDNGYVKLFRSHNPDYADGGQLRDFIYVKDVTDVIWFLLNNAVTNGIYNLGTGKARTFLDLATGVFTAMGKPADIRFIDTPEDIRDKYQYFTEADMTRLRNAGYTRPFTDLESGIRDYVTGYLLPGKYL
jgi:ADP-L-glycero-D-manno-heptose 6-epimerase